MTLVINRIIFHQPLPQKLFPTLFILLAPPAVGMIAWYKLTGQVDSFGRVLYFFALFLELLLVVQLNSFLRLKFYLSWWAYSFPLAAVTIATNLMYEVSGQVFYKYLALGNYFLLCVIIMLLIFMTMKAVTGAEICVVEPEE